MRERREDEAVMEQCTRYESMVFPALPSVCTIFWSGEEGRSQWEQSREQERSAVFDKSVKY